MNTDDRYVCDGCGDEGPDDGRMPLGWVHTMMGLDLCDYCYDY